jgi:hypothetical protein
MFKILTKVDQEILEKLNLSSFNKDSKFWINPDLLKWTFEDDYRLIIGIIENKQLISVLTLRLFFNQEHLLYNLWGIQPNQLPPKLTYPVFVTSRGATNSAFLNSGYNTRLRRLGLTIADHLGINFSCISIIEGSPRIETLKKFGYEFIKNSLKWNTHLYKSEHHSIVGFLDLEKNRNRFLIKDDVEALNFFNENKDSFSPWLRKYQERFMQLKSLNL